MDYVKSPSQIEGWVIHEGVEAKLVASGSNMTALMTWWKPGTRFAVHQHPHEQIGICLQGEGIFTIAGRDYPITRGQVYHIPSEVPHGERNEGTETVVFMECFAPVREDLLQKKFAQKKLEA